MRRLSPILAAVLGAACAFTDSRPEYTAGDPLGAGPAPVTVPGVFNAVVAPGYILVEGTLNPPVRAMLTRPGHGGESAFIVERYEDIEPTAFLRNLGVGEETPPETAHTAGGKSIPVRHGLEFSNYTRRISDDDPFADYLGTQYKPPRMSPLETRRFLRGGEAYRLYRCRRLNAWGLLGDYRRARTDKKKLALFLQRSLGRSERKILATCFGRTVISAVDQGLPLAKITKPSMYRLRLIAREERERGSVRTVEKECVHLRQLPLGFLVLRFRAPKDHFESEHRDFLTFLLSYVHLGP